jgi:hypothetical protein
LKCCTAVEIEILNNNQGEKNGTNDNKKYIAIGIGSVLQRQCHGYR